MKSRTTGEKRVSLTAWESKRFARALEKFGRQGCAMASIANLLDLSLTLSEVEPCPRCKEEHELLTSGVVRSGLHLALETIGWEISGQSEVLEEIFNEQGRPGIYSPGLHGEATRTLGLLSAAFSGQQSGSASPEQVLAALLAGIHLAEEVLSAAME